MATNLFVNYLIASATAIYYQDGVERSTQVINKSYDFIVVGGGVAGCLLASKLSENSNVTVLLLERGGSASKYTDVPHVHRYYLVEPFNYEYETLAPQSGTCSASNCSYYASNILGGGSTTDDFIYVRPSKYDFEEWAELGVKGWSYQQLLPLMKELETVGKGIEQSSSRGTKGPIHLTTQPNNYLQQFTDRLLAGARELNFTTGDYNSGSQTKFSAIQKYIKNGTRESSDDLFIRPFLGQRSNLHVLMFANVTKIRFTGNRASGVTYELRGRDNGVQTGDVGCSKEVLVTSGTVGSAQLLMLSGVGPRDQLEQFSIPVVADLPGVGQNLQDHIITRIEITTNVTLGQSSLLNDLNYCKYIRKKDGIYATIASFGLGFLTSKYSKDTDDAQVSLEPFVALADDPNDTINITADTTLLKQRSIGSLRLNSSNLSDPPIVDANYLSDSGNRDRDVSANGILQYVKLVATSPFQAINATMIDPEVTECDQFELFSYSWAQCFVEHNALGIYHFSGTCKMGNKSDPMSVVDSRLRVRKVQGLRVADASIMPTIVRANPVATIYLTALKASKMILEDWKLV